MDDAAALRTAIAAVSAADVVGDDPPLLVGRAGERDQGVGAGDGVFDLYRVACGVDVGD